MAAESKRRKRILQLAAGAAFLAIVAIAVAIVIDNSGSSRNSSSVTGKPLRIEGAREVNRMLRGIYQYGLNLGSEDAPVELIEFGDLQCPNCKMYAEDILPPIIEGPVRSGQVRISFRNFDIVGDESRQAGAAALAAGTEYRGWNYLELFYRNQGAENSGYADEAFLRAVAKAAGVKKIGAWVENRRPDAFETDVTTKQAEHFGFTGTPSFAIRGPGTDGVKVLGTPRSTGDFEKAIEEAAG